METFNVNNDTIHKLCRICLYEYDSMNNIHHSENIYQTPIIELLRTLLSLQIDENEDLPNLICSNCEGEVFQACAFKLKFDQSDKCLKDYLKSLESVNNDKDQIIILVKEEVNDSSVIVPYHATTLNYLDLALDDDAIEVVEESGVRDDTEKLDEIKQEEESQKDTENNHKLVDEVKQEESELENTDADHTIHKCGKCYEVFKTKLQLTDHRRKLSHYIKKTVRCNICKSNVPSQNFKSHFLKHSVKFSCEYCNKSFSNNFNLKRHLFAHTNQTPYKCDFCNARFARQDKLKTHLMTHMVEKPFVCSACGRQFSRKERLNLHEQKLCCNDDSSDTEKYKRKYSCDICSKAFTLITSLNTHKLLHTDKVVICNKCGKPYANDKKLKEHQLKVHCRTPGKEFLCNICAKQYTTNASLHRHLLSHFGLSKSFRCKICDKSFSQSGALNLHLKIHTGEKPYVCHICPKAFNKPSNLQRHIRSHENIRPFSCHVCGKHFSVKTSLTVHLRVHTGEKPFICDICGKKFVDRSSLTKHSKSHKDNGS